MMNDRPNWRNFLQRWISGEADRSDERSLEALAKDDPFLADALEGFRAVPEADHARSVTRMKANLRSKNKKKRRGAIFYMQRIAAVGVLLLGAWFIFRSFDTQNNSVAQNEQAMDKGPETGTAEATFSDSTTFDLTNNSPIEKERVSQEKSTRKPETALDQIAANKNIASPPAVRIIPPPNKEENLVEVPDELDNAPEIRLEEPTKKIELVADDIAINKKKSGVTAMPPPAPEEEIAFAEFDERPATGNTVTAFQTINGQITDRDGYPLIGANILINNTEQGTNSDIDGNFTFQSPVENPELVVSYTGFVTQNIQVQGEQFLNIQLEDNAGALSEVVVTKRFGWSKAKSSERLSFEPKGGFKKFEKYIRQNLRIPQAAIDAGKKGQVTVRFKLDASGKPIDLQIIQPLGFGCDEEAIRLLQDGPKWKGPVDVQTSYSFEF